MGYVEFSHLHRRSRLEIQFAKFFCDTLIEFMSSSVIDTTNPCPHPRAREILRIEASAMASDHEVCKTVANQTRRVKQQGIFTKASTHNRPRHQRKATPKAP